MLYRKYKASLIWTAIFLGMSFSTMYFGNPENYIDLLVALFTMTAAYVGILVVLHND
jgi:hypothetical protein